MAIAAISIGNTTKEYVEAQALTEAHKLQVNLASPDAQDFDGTADAMNIGVTGILPIELGGTGTTSTETFLTELNVYDKDEVNALVSGAQHGVSEVEALPNASSATKGMMYKLTVSAEGYQANHLYMVNDERTDWVDVTTDTSGKIDRVLSAVDGNIPSFSTDASGAAGNISDSGIAISSLVTESELSTETTNRETADTTESEARIAADNGLSEAITALGNINPDWDETDDTAHSFIDNKPSPISAVEIMAIVV